MKFKISEKTYTFTKYKRKQYVIYINPTMNELSAENETKNNRGIIDKNGDLYVEARILDEDDDYDYRDIVYSDMMHEDMIFVLRRTDKTLFQGLNNTPDKGADHWGLNEWYLSKMLCVNRIEDTNKFTFSEIYQIEIPDNTPILKMAKKKNPTLKFI